MAKQNVPMPRKISKSTIIIYAVIVLFIIIACIIFGSAMDYAVKPDGKVDIALLESGLDKVLSHPQLIFKALLNKNGYTPKMIFLGVSGCGIFSLYKYSEDKKRLHRRGTEYGSAKWGDEKEIRELAEKEKKPEFKPILTADGKRVFDDNGDFVGVTVDNNIILSKEVRLSLNAKQHLLNFNVLIIGGSGSGKTRFYAKPNIMQLNTSYVATDPKGEIIQSTGKMLIEAGYKVRVFNLIQMEHSNNYNPFHYVYDYNGKLSEDSVKKMVNVLFNSTKGEGEKEDFWSQKGQSLLESIVYLLFEESEYDCQVDENGVVINRDLSHLNFFSVTEKMRKLMYPPSNSKVPDGFFLTRNEDESEEEFRARQNKAFLSPLDKDFIELEKRKGDCLALRLYKEVRNAPEETGQSFLSSANVKTFMFNMENVRNLTCCDNINLEKLGDEKTALFLIVSATDSTYNFLAAMLYTQMFDVLANRANFKYKGALPVHVRCIMDEFPNLGRIPDFDKVIAVVRSMGMSLNVIIQNMAQLKAMYEKTWEVITGNCDSLLFLGGKEENTLKYISESLGKETIDVKSANRTKGKSPSTSENNSILGRELLLPNEIGTMSITDCVLLMRSHNPFYCQKYPIEKHPNYELIGDNNSDNNFDVSKIKAVSFKEIISKEKKVDININFSKSSSDEVPDSVQNTIETFFKKEEATVTCDTYEDAEEMYSSMEINTAISEEYTNEKPMYGELSELETLDLGEPAYQRGEVKGDDENHDEETISVNSKVEIHFSELSEQAEKSPDISNEFHEAVINIADYVSELKNTDDYGMDIEMFS